VRKRSKKQVKEICAEGLTAAYRNGTRVTGKREFYKFLSTHGKRKQDKHDTAGNQVEGRERSRMNANGKKTLNNRGKKGKGKKCYGETKKEREQSGPWISTGESQARSGCS